jgi:hypothetical protein
MSISEQVRQEVEVEVEQPKIEAPKPKIYATPDDIPELNWYGKLAAGGLTIGAGLLMTAASLAFINYARSENPALLLIPVAGVASILATWVNSRKNTLPGYVGLSEKENNDLPPV